MLFNDPEKLRGLYNALPKAAKPWMELEVKAYNINSGHSQELLEKNRDLGEYAKFVEVVRGKKTTEGDPEEMYGLAIDECIGNNILREFLDKYREEVMSSILNISREEYVQILLDEAREDANRETAQKMKAYGDPVQKIADVTGLSPEEIEKL